MIDARKVLKERQYVDIALENNNYLYTLYSSLQFIHTIVSQLYNILQL